MPPLVVLSEYPNLHYFDDNAMMALIPLAFAIVLNRFGTKTGDALFKLVHQ
jgi:hypothetical protein